MALLFKDFADSPTVPDEFGKGKPVHSNNTRPFRHTKPFAFVFKHYDIAAVAGLLSFWNPSAIAIIVIAFYVQPLDCVAGRGLRPHVSQEVLKLFPPLTDGYSTSSVTRVGFAFSVPAPLMHAGPRVVFGSFCTPVSAVAYPVSTPARGVVSVSQFIMATLHNFSANTKTHPVRNIASSFCGTYYFKASKHSAAHIMNLVNSGAELSATARLVLFYFAIGYDFLYPTLTPYSPHCVVAQVVRFSRNDLKVVDGTTGQVLKCRHDTNLCGYDSISTDYCTRMRRVLANGY